MPPSGDDMGELLVRAQMALHMLQTNFSEFMGVSTRTMRRWLDGITLDETRLQKLVVAVHPRDADLAERIAAYHGYALADLLPRDREADRRLVDGWLRETAAAAGVTPEVLRGAVAAVLQGAEGAGFSAEDLYLALG